MVLEGGSIDHSLPTGKQSSLLVTQNYSVSYCKSSDLGIEDYLAVHLKVVESIHVFAWGKWCRHLYQLFYIFHDYIPRSFDYYKKWGLLVNLCLKHFV